MSKTNIERFDEIGADILGHLYETFPVPTGVSPKIAGLSEESLLEYDPVSETPVIEGERDVETEFFNATLSWLVHAGFILRKDHPLGFATTYVLTPLGLQTLKHVPQPSFGRETLGEKLSAEAKRGARAAASELLNQALSIGTQILAKGVAM